MRISTLRSFASAAALMSAFAVGAQAADLPEGPGKAETTRICGNCHPVAQAVSLRQGQAAWTQTISKMAELGAEGSEAEFTAILNYLVKNFGAGNSTPQTATPSTSARVEARAETESRVPPDRKSPAAATPSAPIPAAKEWRTYGHDSGGQRFSPLTQIAPGNVARLKIAWTYHMRPAGFTGGR